MGAWGRWSCFVLWCGSCSRVAAAATPAQTRIEWEAPESCPDLGNISERVVALRADPGLDQGGLGGVRGVIRREGSGFVLTLELLDGGERKSRLIAADACSDLGEAAALAIALALDGAAAEAAPRAPDATGPGLEDTTPEADTPAAPTTRLLAALVIDTAALAQPALGVSAELRASFGRLGLGAYGTWLPGQRDYVTSDRFVDFGLWYAGVRTCGQLLDGAIEASACASFDAGALHAAGSGLALSREVSDPWLAPGVAVELSARPWNALGLHAHAGLAAPLVRRPYVVNESDAVHRLPVVVPRLALGAFWTID